MQKLYTVALLLGFACLLLSFSTNPPDGHTGAPGEQLCVACHIQQNPPQNGTISLAGFPDIITPGETYPLTVTNRVTSGTAVRAGFQVTILSPINTRAGDFSSPSANSAISVFDNRQYWDHSPAPEYPDSNVVHWSVLWTAPNLAPGSEITWYAAGNIADGNFSNVGDKIVTANGSGTILATGVETVNKPGVKVFPNPGSDMIAIVSDDAGTANGFVNFYSPAGQKISRTPINAGHVIVPELPAGFYLLEISTGAGSHFVKWFKI